MAGHSLSDEREKTYNPDYYTQQGSHSDMKQKSSFTDKQRLREFGTTKLALQQMTKDLLRQKTQKRFINSNPKQQSKLQQNHTYQ